MLTRPTTEQVLRGIVNDLNTIIGPDLQSEPARVALGMITQLLNGCAVRSAHEIAWMFEECLAIEQAVASVDDPATKTALANFRQAETTLHLDDVVARYHLAGEALSLAIEHAYRVGDAELAASLRKLLKARSDHEMAIVGQLELVGRG